MPISTIGQNGLNAPLSLTSPNLGTPSAINLSNATALAKAALPTGSVLQVVSTYTNAGFTSTTSTSYVATTLSASITPTSSTSKFLIIFTGGVYTTGSGFYAIFRNGSNILNNQILTQVLNVWSTQGGVAYDSPATTSALTYAVYMKAGSGTTYWGGDSPLTNTLTIMEIAA